MARNTSSSSKKNDAFEGATLSQDDVVWHNKLAQNRQAVSFTLNENNVFLKPFHAFTIADNVKDWAQVDFEIEGRLSHLYCSGGLLRQSVTRLDPAITLDNLTPENAALLIEHALSFLLDAWSGNHFPSIQLKRVYFHAKPTNLARLGLSIHFDELTYFALLQLDTIHEKLFLDQPIQPLEDHSNFLFDIMVSVCLRVGWTEITLEELKALNEGDGIILDSEELSKQKMMAVIGEHFAQSVEIQARELVLEGSILSLATETIGRYCMNEEEQRSETRTMESDIKGLPIKLVFELGRVDVPLSELETMNAGYVFDMARQPTRAVDILANGRKIGNGEVVRVGESLGIRVVNIDK